MSILLGWTTSALGWCATAVGDGVVHSSVRLTLLDEATAIATPFARSAPT